MARPSDVFGDMSDDALMMGAAARRRALGGSTTKPTAMGGNPLEFNFSSAKKKQKPAASSAGSLRRARPPIQGGVKTAGPVPAAQQAQSTTAGPTPAPTLAAQQTQPSTTGPSPAAQQTQSTNRFFQSERSNSPKIERGRSSRGKRPQSTSQAEKKVVSPVNPSSPARPVAVIDTSTDADSFYSSDGDQVIEWNTMPNSSPPQPPPPTTQSKVVKKQPPDRVNPSVSSLLAKKRSDLANLKKKLEQIKDTEPPQSSWKSEKQQSTKRSVGSSVGAVKKKPSISSKPKKIQKNVMPSLKTVKETKIRTESHSRVSSAAGGQQSFSMASVAAPAPPLLNFDEMPVGVVGRSKKKVFSPQPEPPTPESDSPTPTTSTLRPVSELEEQLSISPETPKSLITPVYPSPVQDHPVTKPEHSVVTPVYHHPPAPTPVYHHPVPTPVRDHPVIKPEHSVAKVEYVDIYKPYWPTPTPSVLPWEDPHSCQCCGRSLNICYSCQSRPPHNSYYSNYDYGQYQRGGSRSQIAYITGSEIPVMKSIY